MQNSSWNKLNISDGLNPNRVRIPANGFFPLIIPLRDIMRLCWWFGRPSTGWWQWCNHASSTQRIHSVFINLLKVMTSSIKLPKHHLNGQSRKPQKYFQLELISLKTKKTESLDLKGKNFLNYVHIRRKLFQTIPAVTILILFMGGEMLHCLSE